MIETELTKKALAFTKEFFRDKIDECGRPVMDRLLYVAERMDDESSTCVALFQDIELDPMSASYNYLSDYPAEVARAAEILPFNEYFYFDYLDDPYDVYINGVMTNEVAEKVKLEDLRYRINTENYVQLTIDLLRRIQMYKAAFERIDDHLKGRKLREPVERTGAKILEFKKK